MDKLPLLEKKVNELVKEAVRLKRENEKLRSELEFVQGDKSKAQKALKDAKTMSDEKELIRKKIAGILEKFEKITG